MLEFVRDKMFYGLIKNDNYFKKDSVQINSNKFTFSLMDSGA